MADDSVWNKFKTAFDDPPKPTQTVNRDPDPAKAKAFSSVFNGEAQAGKDDAISRRLKQIVGSY